MTAAKSDAKKSTAPAPETVADAPDPTVPGETEAPTAEQLERDASFAAATAADYRDLVAVAPCMYFGQLAFAAGQAVPASHPSVPVWVAEGCVARVKDEG